MLSGLLPGRYQAMIMEDLGETGYTSEAAEFEITNDNVSGVELKAFLGASVSGFVVIEGADAAARNQLKSMVIQPSVTPLSDATGDANERLSVTRYLSLIHI